MAMPEIKTPLSDMDRIMTERIQKIGILIQVGKWDSINTTNFPGVDRDFLESAREKAFDSRIAYIGEQMSMLGSLIGLFSDKREVQSLANGRIEELRSELGEILKVRFPNTKPVPLNKTEETAMLLNRDTNTAINFFVSMGEVEALNKDTIPALKHLKQETLMELKIDALLAKLDRYKTWKKTEIDSENYGFSIHGKGEDKSPLDQLADAQIEETITQLMNISAERLDLKKIT